QGARLFAVKRRVRQDLVLRQTEYPDLVGTRDAHDLRGVFASQSSTNDGAAAGRESNILDAVDFIRNRVAFARVGRRVGPEQLAGIVSISADGVVDFTGED